MKKNIYTSPSLTVCELEVEDAILTGSGGNLGIDDTGFGGAFGAPMVLDSSNADDAYFTIKGN